MPASLASTLSLITGPALLTNASTVLLLGATNRLSMVHEDQRRLVRRKRPSGASSPAPRATAHITLRRQDLLRKAMLLLQVAVGSFGFGTLTAMLALSVEQTLPMWADIITNPALLLSATIGGIALILGVLTLFVESWLLGSTLP
ncbi:DUF2721 domain-containing protein [Cupriavidus necator]|uniref:DUF2721 domain-containing protein n=1 Tax=Cupriavidus necator TaxID=106590 RepID=UPI0012D2D377|nr:DUF2721 domain-containing protein [Cupriavidus necator]